MSYPKVQNPILPRRALNDATGFVDVMIAQHALLDRLIAPDVEPYTQQVPSK